MLCIPNLPTHQRQSIRKGGRLLMIPGGLTNGQWTIFGLPVCQQSNQRKQPHQDRRSPLDGGRRPLALGFHTQMSADFMEGNLHLPTTDKPTQDLTGFLIEISTQQGLSLKLSQWIADQHPANREGGQATGGPKGGTRK